MNNNLSFLFVGNNVAVTATTGAAGIATVTLSGGCLKLVADRLDPEKGTQVGEFGAIKSGSLS